jgi:SAM-dependent methyltransferase
MYPASSMPDREWWTALWPDPESTLRGIGIREGITALDLCCGDGYFTAPMARLLKGQVYALDLNPELIQKAKAEVAEQRVSVLRWFTADASNLGSLLPEPVDYVLLANTFHGVPDKVALTCAVREVLKPDGRFGILNWKPLPRETTLVQGQPRGPRTDLRMPAEAVAQIMVAGGLGLEPIVDVGHYHYAVVARRA